MKFNDNLVNLRKKKGWSQEELADKLDMSRQAVSKWEVGTSKPDIDNAIKISKLFGVSIDELVNNDIVKTEAISINVKKKSKKQKLMVWLRRTLIVLAVIYVVNVIYNFAVLFTITQAELKYKELNNYHYIITTYDNEGLKEKEECWFKDGVSKTSNIVYTNGEPQETITYFDFNNNKGYVKDGNLSNIAKINMEEYSIYNMDFIGKNQFYSRFPNLIKNRDLIDIVFKSKKILNFNVKIDRDNIFIYLDDNQINIDKDSMQPYSYYYKDKTVNKFLIRYFTLELDTVKEIQI